MCTCRIPHSLAAPRCPLKKQSCFLSLQAKGNTTCDICKQMITNLPPVDPELLAKREAAR